MSSVSIVFRKDCINKNGEAPINFFIIKDRRLTKVALGIKVHQDMWDDKNKRIKSKHSNAKKLNSLISNKFAELQDQVLENETIAKSLTGRQLKENLFGQKPLDFLDFADQAVKDYKQKGAIGTHDRCMAIINKLRAYLGAKTIYFQEITPAFLAQYERHLRDDLNNRTNTVHSNLKFFRKLFNDAIRLEQVDPRHNPFSKYKIKTEKTQRTYLTEDELKAIASVHCAEGSRLELHRDMFVFAAYAGGMRISDILQLKWANIDNTHIRFTIKKTLGQLSIKMPIAAQEIIAKYKPKKIDKNNYVFPMLDNNLKESDPILMDAAISSATAYVNKNLANLAKKAELKKHISFHISRHTFATRALQKGLGIDKVSKIMGHAQIRETQIYAKIVNEELDKAMDLFDA